jgi:hypothetical protein
MPIYHDDRKQIDSKGWLPSAAYEVDKPKVYNPNTTDPAYENQSVEPTEILSVNGRMDTSLLGDASLGTTDRGKGYAG